MPVGSQRQSRGAAARNGAEPTQLTTDGGNTSAACALIDDGVLVGVQDVQHRAVQRERSADQWLAVIGQFQHSLPTFQVEKARSRLFVDDDDAPLVRRESNPDRVVDPRVRRHRYKQIGQIGEGDPE